MSTTIFTRPYNDLALVLTANYTPGSGVLAVADLSALPGDTPSTTKPLRLSIDRVRDGAKTILIATGRSGLSLTGCAAAEGKADIPLYAGDVAKVRLSAGYISDLQDAHNTLETTVDGLSAGQQGPAGQGVPTGGSAGQVLAKASSTDYDDHWIDPPASGAGLAANAYTDTQAIDLAADHLGLVATLAPGQTQDAIQVKSSGGAVLARVDHTGAVTSTLGGWLRGDGQPLGTVVDGGQGAGGGLGFVSNSHASFSAPYGYTIFTTNQAIASNHPGVVGLRITLEVGQTAAAILVRDASGNPLASLGPDGSLTLPVIAGTAALGPSLFFGSDHLDGFGAPKLCRKDAAGNVTPIG